MKKFIFHITSFLLMTLLLMYLLDLGYTKVYQKANPRTKIQYLRKQKDKDIDYIFIGSSRVESGIVPSIIEERTHKKVLNLGFQAARLYDIYAILQLVKYYKIHNEKIFIQVDYIYNMNTKSQFFKYQLVPFIYENKIYDECLNFNYSNYFEYKYFPFYRYAKNDLKLGFREIILNLVHKKTNTMNNNGFSPLKGTSKNHCLSIPKFINQNNSSLDSIRLFCRRNKIDVVFFCAPFCSHTTHINYINKLKNKVPELLDFSHSIKDESMFKNANHLNFEGAKHFTQIFIDKVLINKE